MKTTDPNLNFLRNRAHRSGYGVTLHTSGHMGEATARTKQAALELAQSKVLNGEARSATVFPRRHQRMRVQGRMVFSVHYTLNGKTLNAQF